MTDLYRIPGASFAANANAQNLSAYGYLPDGNRDGLYRLNDSSLTNDGDAGLSALSFAGTASGAELPTWADGVLTVPKPATASSYYSTGITLASLKAFTVYGVMYVPATAALFNVFEIPASTSVYVRCNSGTIETNYATGSALLTNNLGGWTSFVVCYGATNIRAIGPRGVLKTFTYNGTPPTTSPLLRIGSSSTGSYAWQGKYALFGAFNRELTDDEMEAVRNGMRVFAAAKNIRI